MSPLPGKRTDLAALTPEKVTELANAGLVKRAIRELDAGQGPELEEDAAGVVRGKFEGGVTATLPPHVLLRDAPCSCGSVAVCRHRVATALAYARRVGAPAAVESWSPGELDDATVEKALGKRVLDRARRLAASPLVVTLTPGPTPEAALPTCGVRFLVPRDLAYARCDCAAGGGCEHVGLAVLAFREAERAGPLVSPRTVELGARPAAASTPAPGSSAAPTGATSSPPATTAGGAGDALAEAFALVHALLHEGLAHAPGSFATRFARARAPLERAGLAWPLAILDELEEQLLAYRERSARYRAPVAAGLLAELAARARASRCPGELPAAAILGQGEPRETLLDQVQLVSLGARVDGTGSQRTATVFLADPDSGTVLVLERSWTGGESDAAPAGPELARRSIAPNVRLDQLAKGQVVSRAVKRRANRTISLGTGTASRTSVLGQAGDWGRLGSLVVTRAQDLERALAARPPRILAPRFLADSVRVLAPARVHDLAYAPGAQVLSAVLELEDGSTVALERHHRAAAPHALEALAAALVGPGAAPRFVSGEVRRTHHGLVLDPLAVAGERIVVPDLEALPEGTALPLGAAPEGTDPVEAALAVASGELEALAHGGLGRAGPPSRVREIATKLDAVGLGETAGRLRTLGAELASRAAGEPGEKSAQAWCDAAIRVALAVESASDGGAPGAG